MSARSAAGRPMRKRKSSGWRRSASPTRCSRRIHAPIGPRHRRRRRPRSPSRSCRDHRGARSSAGSAAGAEGRRGVKFGRRPDRRGRRRHPGAYAGARTSRSFCTRAAICRPRMSPSSRPPGIARVVAARLDPGDVHEDEAARRSPRRLPARASRSTAPFTGRATSIAREAGVARASTATASTRSTRIDESDHRRDPCRRSRRVEPAPDGGDGQDHSLCRRRAAVDRRGRSRRRSQPLVSVAPFKPMRVGLVQTVLPGTQATACSTRRCGYSTAAPARSAAPRSSASGACAHDARPIAEALGELQATAPTSSWSSAPRRWSTAATSSRRRSRQAGGDGRAFRHAGRSRQPAAARRARRQARARRAGLRRSPKENGFDWVLDRLLAGLPVGRDDDRDGLGVGGLLMEIPTRPQPRDAASRGSRSRRRRSPRIVLAAGRSTRMGGPEQAAARARRQAAGADRRRRRRSPRRRRR